jgi:hypothetical protein
MGTLLSLLVPGALLWLLGSQYSQLGGVVWLAVLASGTSALAGVLYSLNVNKGWIPPASVLIPAEIISQVVLCFIFDLSTVRGVLLIGVLGPIIPSLMNLAVGIRKLKSP